MARSKEIKFINYVIINGEKIRMDSLSEEDRKEVADKLNETAMKALGYTRVDDTA